MQNKSETIAAKTNSLSPCWKRKYFYLLLSLSLSLFLISDEISMLSKFELWGNECACAMKQFHGRIHGK